MADGVNIDGPWEEEAVPREHLLYLRVNLDEWKESDGTVSPGFFSNRGDDAETRGMSSDWCKYHDTMTTYAARRNKAAPYGVIKLLVDDVLKIPLQSVRHTPRFISAGDEANNRAHTDVRGPKSPRNEGIDKRESIKIRGAFSIAASWCELVEQHRNTVEARNDSDDDRDLNT